MKHENLLFTTLVDTFRNLFMVKGVETLRDLRLQHSVVQAT